MQSKHKFKVTVKLLLLPYLDKVVWQLFEKKMIKLVACSSGEFV